MSGRPSTDELLGIGKDWLGGLSGDQYLDGAGGRPQIDAADLIAAAAVVQVRAATAPALASLAQRLLDAAHADVTDTHCQSVAALTTIEGDE